MTFTARISVEELNEIFKAKLAKEGCVPTETPRFEYNDDHETIAGMICEVQRKPQQTGHAKTLFREEVEAFLDSVCPTLNQ